MTARNEPSIKTKINLSNFHMNVSYLCRVILFVYRFYRLDHIKEFSSQHLKTDVYTVYNTNIC